MKHIFLFFLLIISTIKPSYAFDSMVEYENKTLDGTNWFSHIDNCFSSGKAIFPLSVGDFNNVSIPHYLTKNPNIETSTRAGWSELASFGRATAYIAMLSSFSPASIVALVAIGIEYIIMLDVCTNAYIIAPHEYANLALGLKCSPPKSSASGDVKFVKSKNTHNVLTALDVPFFYHCDPKYDPDTGRNLTESDNNYKEKLDNTYGYMGEASEYCTNDFGKMLKSDSSFKISSDFDSKFPKDPKKLIGHALVYYTNVFSRISDISDSGFGSFSPIVSGLANMFDILLNLPREQHESCTLQPGGTLYNITGDTQEQGFYRFIGYYRFDDSIGKVQLCVAAPFTLFPVKIGCTYVPPPVNLTELPQFDAAEGTRCQYFQEGRKDLKSLGLNIMQSGIDDPDGNKKSVSNFLMSDMHVTSTTAGCILDLLDKIFISSEDGNKGFFEKIQENLRPIILAALLLYLCLVGIKIMTSGESIQRSEYVMFAIKFALVAYFTLGNAWYGVDEKGNKFGIYYGIMDGAQKISSFFMEAQNIGDPMGYCRYKYDGENQILSQINIPATGMTPTVGPQSSGISGYNDTSTGSSIKMTVFDLIDCRIINYLNFGTCSYSIPGLIAVWSITALILVSGVGFVLFIVMFLYSYMLLKILFKFVHIFILSMFVITILVAVSPIMIIFSLYEFTKGIFEQWLKMLIGYIIYPGLHFAFIALMLATFDNIYFGGLDIAKGNIFEQCRELGGAETPICAIANNTAEDIGTESGPLSTLTSMCDLNIGQIVKGLYETKNLWLFGKYTVFNLEVAESFFKTMPKLALMAFLFFMLMNSISTFFSILTGVQSVSGMSKGDISGNFVKTAFWFASKPITKSVAGLKKLTNNRQPRG